MPKHKTTTARWTQASALLLATFAVAACGKKDEAPAMASDSAMMTPMAPMAASVSAIETGKHLGSNMRVTEVTSTFAPMDTMFVAVVTENSMPTNALIAKWTFGDGQLVDSTMQMIAPTAGMNTTAVTEFHVVKPGGWPVGMYKVELWLDGVPVGTRDIEVKK